MSEPALVVETIAGVRVLRLNEPARRNALSDAIRHGLEREVPAFFADDEARCLLVTGTGDSFCAGGDLASLDQVRTVDAMRERMQRSHGWVSALLTRDKPVVCAVNGPAVGAGLGLALLGDITVASEDAYFLPGFVMVGAAPDYGLGWTLPRAVGAKRAADILMTNRKIAAPAALAMGLVSRVLPTEGFQAAAMEIAQSLAQGPQVALAITKSLLLHGATSDVDEFLAVEADAQAEALMSPDAVRLRSTFLNKSRKREG
ncbi:MAG: enoyl-CoA hydratase/isomerase family protein [Rhizobiaceae bacterium]|nr:enoyl-CoA hydratase/isomerase family protein [Rhizobiaceae bacterium]